MSLMSRIFGEPRPSQSPLSPNMPLRLRFVDSRTKQDVSEEVTFTLDEIVFGVHLPWMRDVSARYPTANLRMRAEYLA